MAWHAGWLIEVFEAHTAVCAIERVFAVVEKIGWPSYACRGTQMWSSCVKISIMYATDAISTCTTERVHKILHALADVLRRGYCGNGMRCVGNAVSEVRQDGNVSCVVPWSFICFVCGGATQNACVVGAFVNASVFGKPFRVSTRPIRGEWVVSPPGRLEVAVPRRGEGEGRGARRVANHFTHWRDMEF